MISTTGEYALRAAVFLARHHEAPQTTSLIAHGTGVSQGYLSKLLQSLVRAQLIQSQRGLHGGFVLARSANDITVLDILKAVDAAPRRIARCPLGYSSHMHLCPLHRLLDEAVANVERAFSQSTLEELSRVPQPLCPKG
jgi:Rrf2 family protein